MSDEYQLRAVDQDGEPFGVWCDVAGRKQFWTNGDRVLIRKKPAPRGAGWYQYADTLDDDVSYYTVDPGEPFRKMKIEPQEDQA